LARPVGTPDSLLREKLATPRPDRIHWLLTAMDHGLPAQEICELTKIDPWFIQQIEELTAMNRRAAAVTVETASKELLREAKRHGPAMNSWRKSGERRPRPCVCSARATV